MESSALQALLTQLRPDPVEAAEAYRRLQQRLNRFFNLTAASDPEQLTDRAIERLAQRVAKALNTGDPAASGEVGPPVHLTLSDLIFEVVREVLTEDLHRSQPDDQAVRDWFIRTTNARDTNREQRQAMLQSCLSRLSPEGRRLLEKYYAWSSNHKARHHQELAQALGLSLEALHNRTLHSRTRLEACIRRKGATSRRFRSKGRRA